MSDKEKQNVDDKATETTKVKLSPEFERFLDKTLEYDTKRPHHQLGPLADRIGLHVPPFDRTATFDRYFSKEEESTSTKKEE